MFSVGEIVVTPGVAGKLDFAEIESAVQRHASGDWGEIDEEDRQLNNRRVERGGPIASIYKSSKGVKYYVLTEADRSTTTVLLPEEY
jgi:hypothetical protein